MSCAIGHRSGRHVTNDPTRKWQKTIDQVVEQLIVELRADTIRILDHSQSNNEQSDAAEPPTGGDAAVGRKLLLKGIAPGPLREIACGTKNLAGPNKPFKRQTHLLCSAVV
jgi:hypothetical protein